MELCCYPECVALPVSRGLCKLHYDRTNNRVRRRLTHWGLLEQAGLARPRRSRLMHPAWCEICNERKSEHEIDLSTDEESGPLIWWACTECANIIQ